MEHAARLAARSRARETVLGTWMTIPHPIVAETMARSGLDFLLLDGEHGPAHPDAVAGLLPASDLHGMPVIYRTRGNRGEAIAAALDAGVAGVMVPMVDSRADAERAVAAARYPPRGRRGVGPWRASGYYADLPRYLAEADASTLLILQIESAEALAAIAAIAATPGADALYVGPADLAMSLGLAPGRPHEALRAAYREVAAAGARAGKSVGIDVASLDELPALAGLGFNLFTHGGDLDCLIEGSRATGRALRAGLGR